jgi:hypothetical protein
MQISELPERPLLSNDTYNMPNRSWPSAELFEMTNYGFPQEVRIHPDPCRATHDFGDDVNVARI